MSEPFAVSDQSRLNDIKRLIFDHRVSEGDIARLKELMDREISNFPDSPSGMFARYLRARSYEDGVLGEKNIDAAMEDYLFIMNHGGGLKSEGVVGYARLLCYKDECANAAKALSMCVEAVRIDSNVRAMMFAGYLCDHVMHDLDAAAEWYLRAFKGKLPWGLRFYASLQFRRKKYIASILAHIVATIVGPFFVFRYGKKDPFRL